MWFSLHLNRISILMLNLGALTGIPEDYSYIKMLSESPPAESTAGNPDTSTFLSSRNGKCSSSLQTLGYQ